MHRQFGKTNDYSPASSSQLQGAEYELTIPSYQTVLEIPYITGLA